jgi:hypothetical protein
MKKTLLITVLALAGFVLGNAKKAHAYFSELNLSLFDQSAFTVILDNNAYYGSTTNFTAANVTPGNHHLQVIRYYGNPHKPWMQKSKVVFSGYIAVPANTRLFSVINPYNMYTVVGQQPLHEVVTYNNGWTNGGNVNYTHTGYYDNGNCGNAYYANSLSSQAFANLKQTIVNTNFSSTRLSIAQQAVSANKVTSAQVTELMLLFDFESSKLAFAKYAYANTIDKQNYFMVNNAFTFSSSIDELNRYIGSGM